jgi:hypothetical protein
VPGAHWSAPAPPQLSCWRGEFDQIDNTLMFSFTKGNFGRLFSELLRKNPYNSGFWEIATPQHN